MNSGYITERIMNFCYQTYNKNKKDTSFFWLTVYNTFNCYRKASVDCCMTCQWWRKLVIIQQCSIINR